MTIDVNNVPQQPTIVEINALTGKNLADIWSQQGASLTGVIHRSLLSGADPNFCALGKHDAIGVSGTAGDSGKASTKK